MISIFFIQSVPVLEPLGRQKNYRERVSSGDLGGELACRIWRGQGGWFVTNGLGPDGKERCSEFIKFPVSFVPDANVKFIEGMRDELEAAYGIGADCGAPRILPTVLGPQFNPDARSTLDALDTKPAPPKPKNKRKK